MRINGREIRQTSGGRYRAQDAGFGECGENVEIGDARIYGDAAQIRLGSNIRIDDFVVIVIGDGGALHIGDYGHIGPHCSLHCHGEIMLSPFVAISAACHLYSASDDYLGKGLTGPTVPAEFRRPVIERIAIGTHCIIGVGTVIGPGVSIHEGVSVAANSVVMKSLDAWGVYGGAPARFLKKRSTELLDQERALCESR